MEIRHMEGGSKLYLLAPQNQLEDLLPTSHSLPSRVCSPAAVPYWDTSCGSLWLKTPRNRCCTADHFHRCKCAWKLCVCPILHKYLLRCVDLYCWYFDCMRKVKRRKEENKRHQCCLQNQGVEVVTVHVTLLVRGKEKRHQQLPQQVRAQTLHHTRNTNKSRAGPFTSLSLYYLLQDAFHPQMFPLQQFVEVNSVVQKTSFKLFPTSCQQTL